MLAKAWGSYLQDNFARQPIESRILKERFNNWLTLYCGGSIARERYLQLVVVGKTQVLYTEKIKMNNCPIEECTYENPVEKSQGSRNACRIETLSKSESEGLEGKPIKLVDSWPYHSRIK